MLRITLSFLSRPILMLVAYFLGALTINPPSFAQIKAGVTTDALAVTSNSSQRVSGTVRFPRVLAGSPVLPKAMALPLAPGSSTISSSGYANTSWNISTHSYGANQFSDLGSLPLWTFDLPGPRDGNHHRGTMVGHDPFRNPGTDRVPTYIIPLIIRTHTIGTSWDSTTGVINTAPGDNTMDPTQPDNICMSAPNNVAVTLTRQSPLFVPTTFAFGQTVVGTTQYIDAFQRANFWNVLGSNAIYYHLLLSPVITLAPVVIDVPNNEGLALINPLALGPPAFCAPVAIVDFNWFDSYVTGTLLPQLKTHGLSPSTLPLFLTYNAFWASPVTQVFNGYTLGYHSVTGTPIPTQTYAAFEFDTTNFFLGPFPDNTSILAHELGEWSNDPFVTNETAPWGPSGQVAGCSNLLEVGDPLTATDIAPIVMPNGYSYVLQELAFFSWFVGGPSTGVNGWFSNNGSFLTDAGVNCP